MPLKIAYRKRKMAASKGKSQIGAGKKNMPALVKKIGKMAYAVRNILALRNCAWWSAIRTSFSFNTLLAIIKSAPEEIKLTIIVRKDTVPGYIKMKNTLPKPNTTKGVKTPNKYAFFSNATLQAQLGIIALILKRTTFQPFPLATAQPTPCNNSCMTTEIAIIAINKI